MKIFNREMKFIFRMYNKGLNWKKKTQEKKKGLK